MLLASHSLTKVRPSEYAFRGDLRQNTVPGASQQRDLIGKDALPKLLSWLANLTAVFDRFGEEEKRAQLGRKLTGVASAFAKVNNECVKIAIMLEAARRRNDTEILDSFDRRITSIIDSRGATLALGTSRRSGVQGWRLARPGSRNSPGSLQTSPSEAREQLLGKRQSEAPKRWLAASELARRTQQIVNELIPFLNKQ
jgi:hypothetical protein